MIYAEAFKYDRHTVVIHTRDADGDAYCARDLHTGRVGEGASLRAAVGRLRGGR